MKYFNAILILVIALSISTFSNAQVVINPSPVTVPIANFAQVDIAAHSFVINNSEDSLNFVWERHVVFMTDGWQNAVCDRFQCHFTSVSSSEFYLLGGESQTMDVHVYPDNIEGSAIIEVKVTEIDNPTNTDTGVYYFNTTTSISERLTNAISIYPNPVVDVLTIESGKDVYRMDFVGMDGKLAESKIVAGENSVDVGSLSTGSYVVRMLNKDGEQISSNLIVKE